jgi:hypothetical protein
MRSIEELYVLMQLSMGLQFTSFISFAILRLGLNGSGDSDAYLIFYYTAGELKMISIFSGAVHFGSRF